MNADEGRSYLGETITVPLEDGLSIQATIAYGDDSDVGRMLVVCPPNPILGGDSENNVVQALLEAAVREGGLGMTFDYRGVAEGRVGDTDLLTYWEELERAGDYDRIVEDSMRAIAAAQREFGGVARPSLVGYSFGTLIALRCAEKLALSTVGGVSPPILECDFAPLLDAFKTVHFFAAPEDIFCPLAEAETRFAHKNVSIHTVPSEDHFFRGEESVLADEVLSSLAGIP